MLWWNHQSKVKKVLYGGAFLCLAAGLSTKGYGTIAGFLLFLISFSLALFLPEKKGKTPEQKAWINVISPHFNKKERKLHWLINLAAFLLVLTDIYFLSKSLLESNYILIFLCTTCLIIIFTSWLMMNPYYYNQIYLTSKIVPLRRETTTQLLYDRAGDINTPYGTALLGFVPGHDKEVAVYRLIDIFWVVYYYVENNEIRIEAKRLNEEQSQPKETELVFNFTQQLADLFCYIENTGDLPDVEELSRIFFPLES